MQCVCSVSAFDIVGLSSLAQLETLHLSKMLVSDFTVPNSWVNIRTLTLHSNMLTTLPQNLSALCSLTTLYIGGQHAPMARLQLIEPMSFLTQLRNLKTIRVKPARSAGWDVASLIALAQTRSMLQGMPSPACDIQIDEE